MLTPAVDDVLSAALVAVLLARCLAGRGPRALALGHLAVAAAMTAMAVAPLLPHPVAVVGLPAAAASCAGLAAYFGVRMWRLRGPGSDVVVMAETRRLVVASSAMATLLLIGDDHGSISGAGALLVSALALVGVGYFVLGACARGPQWSSRSDRACLVAMNGLMAAMCLMVP